MKNFHPSGIYFSPRLLALYPSQISCSHLLAKEQVLQQWCTWNPAHSIEDTTCSEDALLACPLAKWKCSTRAIRWEPTRWPPDPHSFSSIMDETSWVFTTNGTVRLFSWHLHPVLGSGLRIFHNGNQDSNADPESTTSSGNLFQSLSPGKNQLIFIWLCVPTTLQDQRVHQHLVFSLCHHLNWVNKATPRFSFWQARWSDTFQSHIAVIFFPNPLVPLQAYSYIHVGDCPGKITIGKISHPLVIRSRMGNKTHTELKCGFPSEFNVDLLSFQKFCTCFVSKRVRLGEMRPCFYFTDYFEFKKRFKTAPSSRTYIKFSHPVLK